MEHYEMAELLSKKAGVSLEEARQALTENDWDMLDAMVALERRHKKEGPTVTVDGAGGEAGQDGSAGAGQPQPVKNMAKKDPVFTNGFSQIWRYIKKLFQVLVENEFVVIRREKTLLAVPVLVLVILLLCCFWVMLPVLIVGLFCGCQYRFEGKHPARDGVNKAMDKIGEKFNEAAEHIKDSLGGDDQQ